jgi:hypothetical protein
MVVEKAVNPISVFVNNGGANTTFPYGTLLNITATGMGVKLWLNGTLINSGEGLVLPAGTYTVLAASEGNENYTAGNSTAVMTITKADNPIFLTLNGSSNTDYMLDENETFVLNGTSVAGTLTLYRDDTILASGEGTVGAIESLPYREGGYRYVLEAADGQNYTGNMTSLTVRIREPPRNDTNQTENTTQVNDTSPQPSGGGGGGSGGAITHPGFTPIANDTGDAPIAAPVNATNITKVNVTKNITDNKPKEPEFDGGPIGMAASALLMATAVLPDFKIRRLLKRSKKPKKEQLQEPKEKPKAIDLAGIIAETRRTYMLYPTGKPERIAVEMNIARRIQAEQGNFYSAQVIGVLKSAYPNDAPKMEMEIAGEMWEWMNNGGAVPDKRIGGIPFYKLAE